MNKKLIFNDIGEMIFTRKGISGPLVLTLSNPYSSRFVVR
ncbi:MAG: hypothetical protein E6703_04450 [Finegoldia magna]|nr:hypothetical protein [Finegoldia magna]